MSKPRPAYIPDVWDNDAEMKGLMSLPKARHLNPTNHKRVMEFWKDLIAEYCKHEKTCLFSLDELKQKFRRGSQLPSPLAAVIQEMQESGAVQSREEYKKSSQGWVEWGASLLQPAAWLGFGSQASNSKTEKMVHLPTLKTQAKELLLFYRDEYENVDCPEVVDYAELKQGSKNIIASESFEFVIDELVKQGEVSVGRSKDGDKVLKFKDQSSQGPARFTDSDASVHELRRTMVKLENEIKRAEAKATKFEEDARMALRNNDRKGAMNYLRKKKRVQKDIEDKDVQYQRLLSMLEQLAQTKQTKEIIDIYKAGSKAFKDTLARQGLTVADVDSTIDNVHEVMNDYMDIEDTIREGLKNMPTSDTVDDAELESELNEILAEGAGKKSAEPAKDVLSPNQVRVGKRVLDLGDLPDVPSNAIDESPEKARESLEARWKRLRTAQTGQ
ncbi:snf7 domain-containing protein [Ditylenchus destructor]|nr:snf7 domain-containing protein [Ditylenchus destructor]